MNEQKKVSNKLIHYEPTSPDVLEHFAREVCQELGGDFATHDTIRGFANFMKIIARATANQLNQQAGNEVDNSI
jgi:hypothetical protein